MRLHLRLIRKNILFTVISLFLSTSILNIIPYIQFQEGLLKRCLIFISAFLFWSGIVMAVLFSKKTKDFLWSIKISYKLDFLGPPGIVNFSKKHIMLYLVFLVGLVLMISDMIFNYISMYIMFPIISIVFFSFAIHCIVDGKVYKNYKIVRDGKNDGY